MSFIAKNPLSLPEIDYTPSTPLKGTRGLYPKEDGWYDIDDNGNEKKILDSDDKNDIDRVGQKTENNGEIFNDYDNNIASANNSHAEGYKSEAQNDCAHAENNATIASGYGSHSEGNNTHASGNYSHAEGTRSVAKGEASHAEGLKTIASSNNSHAQGENTNAGTKAFKIASSFTNDGSGTIKFNLNSSEGLNDNLIGTPCTLRVANEFSNGITISGYDTTASTITLKGVPADATYETDSDDASTHTVENFIVIQGHPELGDTDVGHNAHAGGYNTLAQGRETFAAGRDNKVVGQYGAVTGRENIVGHGAFASGRKNTALGTMSHAEGSETKAIGSCAHAEGKNTESYGTYSHAEGSYTKAHGDFTHSEGYRSTASGEASHAEGGDTTAEGNYSHAEGYSSYAKGINTHSEGNNTYAEGSASHAEGTDSQSVGQSSHAEGRGTLANGTNSHSEGNSTEARGNHSHAEGVKSRTGNADNTGGYAAHAEGNETEATGSSSHSEGNQTHATASCSHAEGNNTYATGSASHAEGAYTIAASSYQHVQGKYNVVDSEGTYAHIIGNGTGNADDQRKNIHTVDWSGNAWFAGEVTVGADKKKLVTEDDVNSKLFSVYKYKGTKDYYFQLPTNPEIGDVYNIRYASGENYYTEDKLYYNYSVDSSSGLPPFSDYGLEGLAVIIPMSLNDFNNLKAQGDTVIVDISADYRFEIPIRDSCPEQATSCLCKLDDSHAFLIIVSTEEPFNQGTLYLSIKGYLENEKPPLRFNESVDIHPSEPYLINDGDNVAWTGTEWDVLGGTEDMSLYAQTDLSNVDNATFKAKAESAGVGGGSGGGNKDFIVNFTIVDESLKCTTDKTFEEVQASIQAGYNVYGAIGITVDDVYGNVKIPLTIFNEYGCWFTGIHLNRSLSIYLTQNGECGAELMHIADNSIYDALERKADKAEEIYEEDVDSQILGENQPKLFKVSRSRMGLMTGFNPYYVYSGEISSAVDGQATKLYQYKITYDGIYFRTGAREPFVAQNNWMEWAAIGSDSIDLSDCEKISNKTTEINADSTDDQYPSAKAVWEVTKNAGGTPTSFSSIILNSSTEGSTKQFKITIDDNGTLTATELEGNE